MQINKQIPTIFLISILLLVGCNSTSQSPESPISSPTTEPLFTPSLVPADTSKMSSTQLVDDFKDITRLCSQDSRQVSMDCSNASALFGAKNIEAATANAAEPPTGFFASTRVTKSCQASVKNKLKSPSTASFVDQPLIVKTAKLKGLYRLSGQVDAQNSFGAMLRQDYSCYFAYTAKGSDFLGVSIP